MDGQLRREAAAAPRAAYGYAAAGLAVLIWAGWIVLVRGTVATGLGPLDIAVLRYLAPALIFAPLLLRVGPLPRGISPWRMAAMAAGWGAPFALLAAQGLKASPTSVFGALVPGSLPLWVALIGRVGFGARFAPRAKAGLALVAAGALLATVPAMLRGEWGMLGGAPWLVAASMAWASYTVAFRGSGLSPMEATAAVAFWSSLVLAPAALVFGLKVTALPPVEAAAQVALHGVISGVLSVAAFAVAIRELGAARAAAMSALVPVLATLGGVVFLGEAPGPFALAAVAAAGVGVFLVNTAPFRG